MVVLFLTIHLVETQPVSYCSYSHLVSGKHTGTGDQEFPVPVFQNEQVLWRSVRL
jgi:hypothetical protein